VSISFLHQFHKSAVALFLYQHVLSGKAERRTGFSLSSSSAAQPVSVHRLPVGVAVPELVIPQRVELEPDLGIGEAERPAQVGDGGARGIARRASSRFLLAATNGRLVMILVSSFKLGISRTRSLRI
jgi:hypothetical protein